MQFSVIKTAYVLINFKYTVKLHFCLPNNIIFKVFKIIDGIEGLYLCINLSPFFVILSIALKVILSLSLKDLTEGKYILALTFPPSVFSIF